MQLKGRTALVTGGASGIGFGMAVAFAASGMRVAIADIDPDRVRSATARLRERSPNVVGFEVDVADPDSVIRLRDQARRELGEVHLLCNNAGVGCRRELVESTPADWQWVFSVNLFGQVNGMRAFVPIMGGAPGEHHIVNTASMSGLRLGVMGYQSIYTASKFAVLGMTEALRAELEPMGIGLSVLFPGPVTSGMRANSAQVRAIQTGQRTEPEREPEPVNRPTGWLDPEDVGLMVVDAVERDLPYIITHPGHWPAVAAQHGKLAEAFADAERRDQAQRDQARVAPAADAQ